MLVQQVCKIRVFEMLKRKLSKASLVDADEILAKASNSDTTIKSPPQSQNKSKYFEMDGNFEDKLIQIQLELNSELKPLKFKPPVAYIYNPVEYAFKPNETYIKKYCTAPKKLLFVGMNPGPFGMCQTGVPFGEVNSVRDFLHIEEEVDKPEVECPKRPVLGFACTRSEESGKRLWGVLKKLCGTADAFFKNCFVFNYCPLALLKADGGNLTPRDIKDTKELEEICDKYYFKVIHLLQPEIIIGIGEYAEKRTTAVLKANFTDIKVLRLPHPSPRSKNNQNWPEKAEKFFETADLIKYIN